MLNDQGEYIGSLDESILGRPTLNCRTILCKQDDYPLVSLSSLDPDPGVVAAVVEPEAAVGAITGDASAVALASSALASEAATTVLGPTNEALPATHCDVGASTNCISTSGSPPKTCKAPRPSMLAPPHSVGIPLPPEYCLAQRVSTLSCYRPSQTF